MLKNNNKKHELNRAERSKGGSSRSSQKQLAGWLRRYSNPNLNCSNCKKRCELYDKTNASTCSKSEIIHSIQKRFRNRNPEEVFRFMFRSLVEAQMKLAMSKKKEVFKITDYQRLIELNIILYNLRK